MAHEAQERYSALVDAKLRATLVCKDNIVFSTRYEGDPKAGRVKIPVRDTEVEVRKYDKTKGIDPQQSSTAYINLDIDQDEAVNELIDGYDAASVPDGIVAERLDSAGYSQALSIDKKSVASLETTPGVNVAADKTACTSGTAYQAILDAKRYLSRIGVPQDGRFLLASPEFLEALLQDEKYTGKGGALPETLAQQGIVAKVAGFAVFETNNLSFESATITEGKKTTTEFVTGHPNWCHRVTDWSTEAHLQDLSGSGNWIGASAVQGRKIYGIKISKPKTVYIKRTEVDATAPANEQGETPAG